MFCAGRGAGFTLRQYRVGATGATPEQKAALIKGVSDLLFEVLNKPHTATFVVIDEVPMENWGVGGLPVEEYRRQTAGKTS